MGDAYWAEQVGQQLTPPTSVQSLGDKRLSLKKTYLFECYNGKAKVPIADIYFCGLGWVSILCSKQHDVVLKVRTVPGLVHGVRDPLRYKDMKIYNPWPKSKRSVKARLSNEVQDRVAKVVQLTTGPYDSSRDPEEPVLNPFGDSREQAATSSSNGEGVPVQGAAPSSPSSSDPFDDIM